MQETQKKKTNTVGVLTNVPRDIHRLAKMKLAEKEGTFQELIVKALKKYVGAR